MDGILADCNSRILTLANHLLTENFQHKDMYTKHFGDHQSINPKISRHTIHQALCTPEFFYLLKPLLGAITAYRKLKNVYNIHVVTWPYPGNKDAWADKRKWLETYFPGLETKMITTQHKEMVRGDILVDDHIPFLTKWKKANPDKITMSLNYPWINEKNVDYKCKNWLSLTKKLLEINELDI